MCGFCPDNQIKRVSLCVIGRRYKIHWARVQLRRCKDGKLLQVQSLQKCWPRHLQVAASSRRTQPGKIFLVMRTLPASQPWLQLQSLQKSRLCCRRLHSTASEGYIGLKKKLSVYFWHGCLCGKAWRILGLVYRRLSWLQMQKPDSAPKCQNCSTFQTSLNIRTDLAGQLTNISKLISKTRIISMVRMINVHTCIFRCDSIS